MCYFPGDFGTGGRNDILGLNQLLLPLLVLLLWFAACTSNPIGEDEISSGKRQITGKVTLSDKASPAGVLIWLDFFDAGAKTDENGEFSITLPQTAIQGGTSDGVTGIFTLYYFLTNYKLETTQLVVNNGEFAYSQGDINQDGELFEPKSLRKFLSIRTSVEPATVSEDFVGVINVNVHLQTLLNQETAVVRFPSSTLGPLGTIILKYLATGELFVFASLQRDPNSDTQTIGNIEQVISMSFNKTQAEFPLGKYEVIPFMLIQVDPIPAGLLSHFGIDLNLLAPTADYLEIPISRSGGEFEIVKKQDGN